MKLLEQNVSVPETQVTNLQTPPRQKKNCLAKVKQSKVLLNLLFEVKAKERKFQNLLFHNVPPILTSLHSNYSLLLQPIKNARLGFNSKVDGAKLLVILVKLNFSKR